MPTPAEQLATVLASARRVLVFTGAGISTASGIPDYRGPNGVWTKRQPVFYQDFLGSAAKRIEYWRNKSIDHEELSRARPNPAHFAIARLAQLGGVEVLVTQNIDGLHQDAGSIGVIEVHGTNREVECVQCERREPPARALATFRESGECPTCPACEGHLKYAEIAFGQPLRPGVIHAAFRHARQADLALALGSTLSVSPANLIPLAVREHGAPYVIVNRGETDHDGVATLKIDGDVSEILPAAIAGLSPIGSGEPDPR